MARQDTRTTRHVALLWLLASYGHVLTQDVADCTWQPHQDDAVESSSLECHLKTLQTGPAVIPQVCHPNNPMCDHQSCLFACLITECVRGSHSIEHWAGLSSPVFRPSHGFLPVTFLFGFWIRNLPVSVVWALLNGQQTKKVFFLIWQSTNAVICFGQVKSYARLDSELTLIFRRLPARP